MSATDERTVVIPSITLSYNGSWIESISVGAEKFVRERACKCKAIPLECGEGRIAKGQRVCSECGCYLGKNGMVTRDGEFGRPNFCPNCGREVEK